MLITKSLTTLAATVAAALVMCACAGSGANSDCDDGIDNDGDMLIDGADPGCILLNGEAQDMGLPACGDLRDNDGDGAIDFPDDPGCTSDSDDDEFNQSVAQCRDGVDNDGDGLIDFPADPGCRLSLENSEEDDCPNGPNCPQCANGVDDDGDTLIDYAGEDLGCLSASDNNETDECIPGVEVTPLTEAGASGNATGSSFFNGSCDQDAAPEHVYSYGLTRAGLESLTFSTIGSANDTATYVRFERCADPSAELACEDPGPGGEDTVINAPAVGQYFVFVDGDSNGGSYVLSVSGIIPADGTCDPSNTRFVCKAGYKCATDTCKPTRCNDGINNDADSFTDFPNDPGCTSPSDDDETDDCPTGAGCPQCGNGVDDDADGKIDLAQDPGCTSAADDVEDDCPGETEPVEVLIAKTTTGTTVGATSDFVPSCSSGSTAPDRVYSVTIPGVMKTLRFDTEGSALDTVLSIKINECVNDDVGCNDDGGGTLDTSLVELTDAVAGTYLVIVDGYSNNVGTYELNVSGEIKAGAACNDAQVIAGMFACEAGYACVAATCQLAACNDGSNSDGTEDSLVDFPDDPGCDSISDNDESDDCPSGPNCPACSNQVDDDGDSAIDFGADPGCTSASDDYEVDECIPGVEVQILTDAGTTGTTPPTSAGSNFKASCHSSTSSTEHVYAYQLSRGLTQLTFSTVGSTGNTVTHVRFGDCATDAAEVACGNEDPNGEVAVIAAPASGWYYIFVDGDSVSEIDYMLNVSGHIAPGGACAASDTQFVCGPGHLCTGPGVNKTCEPTQCNDGTDNDGDSKADALDPGCDSIDDDTEAPNPNPLPECANGTDDDGDGDTDYPGDLGCVNAADNKELQCNDLDPVVTLTDPRVTGNTNGASNDFKPGCQSTSNAPDLTYRLKVPGNLATLYVDTFGTGHDTVLMMRQTDCSNDDYACADDSSTGGVGPSEIILSNVEAGHYFIIVDGYAGNVGNFVLNTVGVLASGEPCDPAQQATGLITCATGESCTDPGTGHICQ